MPPALLLIKRKESYRGECAGQSAGPERGARGRLRRIKAQSQEPTIGSGQHCLAGQGLVCASVRGLRPVAPFCGCCLLLASPSGSGLRK